MVGDRTEVPLTRAAVVFVVLLGSLALGFSAWGLWRLNTWYLASDQFAFLTLADDMRDGRVFHDGESLALVQPHARAGHRYDAFAQTYIWRDGALFTRYPPGFSALLALAGEMGGERAQHGLNPFLHLVLLVLVGALGWAALRGASAPLALASSAGAVWLLLLLPTQVHLWGITVARDLPAHALAFASLLVALQGRAILAAAFLGLACTVRPDAALYLTSLVALLSLQRVSRRALVGAAVVFGLGGSAALLYNLVVEGNPFVFTQGGEFGDLFGASEPGFEIRPVVAYVPPSGGGFRLSNLRTTLPGNAILLVSAFGWFSLAAAGGLVWALARCRLVVAAVLPYSVIAFLFYGCWSHPDPRYLAGVAALLMIPSGLGLALIARRATEGGWPRFAIGAIALGLTLRGLDLLPAWIPPPGSAGLAVAIALLVVVAVGASATGGSVWRTATLFAPVCALAVLGVLLAARSEGRRDPFQGPAVERARRVVGTLIPQGSLVVTSTSLGRPAENLRYYSKLEAFYPEDLSLLETSADEAAVRFGLGGKRVFFLLDARDRRTLRRLEEQLSVQRRGRRRGQALLEWYVDPKRAPKGAVLYEVQIPPAREEQLRAYVEAADDARRRRPDRP